MLTIKISHPQTRTKDYFEAELWLSALGDWVWTFLKESNWVTTSQIEPLSVFKVMHGEKPKLFHHLM